MNGFDASIAGPWGAVIAIAGMAAVTYLCRIAGVVVMSRVRITPRIERGLRALPGSIIMATILPVIVDSGIAAVLAIGATIVTMVLARVDLVALAIGLGALSLLRALGL
jgi:uncharacterized membrane protein